MTTPQLYQTFARYNRVMNDKLYDAAAGLSDADRRKDQGAFFKSVHGTLNHLVWGDRAWFNRFVERDGETPALGSDLFETFDEMRSARTALDQEIIDWTDTLDPAWLEAEFTWHASSDGKRRTQPAWILVSHLFNHQTHHRGQATTLLTQMGVDVGVTDLARLV